MATSKKTWHLVLTVTGNPLPDELVSLTVTIFSSSENYCDFRKQATQYKAEMTTQEDGKHENNLSVPEFFWIMCGICFGATIFFPE